CRAGWRIGLAESSAPLWFPSRREPSKRSLRQAQPLPYFRRLAAVGCRLVTVNPWPCSAPGRRALAAISPGAAEDAWQTTTQRPLRGLPWPAPASASAMRNGAPLSCATILRGPRALQVPRLRQERQLPRARPPALTPPLPRAQPPRENRQAR